MTDIPASSRRASPIAAPTPLRLHRPHDLRPAGRLATRRAPTGRGQDDPRARHRMDGQQGRARRCGPSSCATAWSSTTARPFNADAVIWNFDKIFNKDCPQFDTRQSVQVRPRLPSSGELSQDRRHGGRAQDPGRSILLFPYQRRCGSWSRARHSGRRRRQGPGTGVSPRSPPATGPARSSSPAWCCRGGAR